MKIPRLSRTYDLRRMRTSTMLAGIGASLSSMAFFGYDVITDILKHSSAAMSYSSGELVHLIFEILAVLGLGYASLTLRAHWRLLQAEATQSQETIQILRGSFDAALHEKFDEWRLTKAERDVTLLMIRGLSVADIASARKTAQGTIKAQSTSIFRKIGVASKTELMSAIIDEFLDTHPMT